MAVAGGATHKVTVSGNPTQPGPLPGEGYLSPREQDYRQDVERRLTTLETTGRNMRWVFGIAVPVLGSMAVAAFLVLRSAINAIGG